MMRSRVRSDSPAKRRRAAVAMALAAGAVVTGAGTAAAAGAVATGARTGAAAITPITGPIYGYGGVCLDDRASGAANGNPVQVYQCNSGSNQQWTVTNPQFGATSTITVYGMCLDVHGGYTWNGDPVTLWGCNGSGAQQWLLEPNGTLVNPNSGKCLDDPAWGGSGTALQIWDCNGGDNQVWEISGLPRSG